MKEINNDTKKKLLRLKQYIMKKKVMSGIISVVFVVLFTGCTAWEDEWMECVPLPDVDEEITPDPWEPPETDDNIIGI